MISSGDNILPGVNLNASINNGIPFYDSILFDQIGYSAVTLGNHDFDSNPDVLRDFIAGTTSTSFISANLDFTNEPGLQAQVTAGKLARTALVDMAFFYAILLVGFAYVWYRGDLDWVRAVSAERAAAPSSRAA
jgi:hypothetical protein